MAGLSNDKVVSDVGRGDNTQRADKSSGSVGQNVSVQVGGNHNVEELGLSEQSVDHGVDNLLVDDDGVSGDTLSLELLLGGGSGNLSEETVGGGQHVGLVGDGQNGLLVERLASLELSDLLSLQSNLGSDGSDLVGGSLGDSLDGLGHSLAVLLVGSLLLDVEILGVLSHNDEIDVLVGGLDGLDGSDVGVQAHLLSQSDNGGRVALDLGGGRGDGSKESTVTLSQLGDSLVGKSGSGLLEELEAGLEVHKLELELVGGQVLEDLSASGNDLSANTVTGDQAWVSV